MFSEVSWTELSRHHTQLKHEHRNRKKLNGTTKQIAVQTKTDKNNSNANSLTALIPVFALLFLETITYK